MKLLEKLKTMIYEEDEDEEEEIAKKIDVEKTIKEEYKEVEKEKPVEEVKTPIIFDVEDFIEEEKPVFKEQTYNTTPPKQEKVLYGGYDNNYKYSNYKEPEVKKEKFKPSLNISPVYGVINSEQNEHTSVSTIQYDRKPIDSLFAEEKSKKVDFDSIRQKAYGEQVKEKDEDSLLYEMQDKEEAPGIAKITLGDAEEYFEDLGLEYNVDYTDIQKEQEKTRESKNKELQKEIDSSQEKQIIDNNKKEEEAEEKSLYDLIDMMYDEK